MAYRDAPARPEEVTWYRGKASRFVDNLKGQLALVRTAEELKALHPHLLSWIKDERNLRAAWGRLSMQGGDAPGPDGLRYLDFEGSRLWQLLRVLREQIRRGQYRTGRTRRVTVPKPSGGQRSLTLLNLADRVVHRGIAQVLTPLFETRFTPTNVGSRQGQDRRHALAFLVKRLMHGACTCAVTDIKDFFGSVPRPRLGQLLAKRLPAVVVDLVIRATEVGKKGLVQGSPLSPLLANIYLSDILDHWWQKTHPETCLLRYVDDILLVGNGPEVLAGVVALEERLRPAGFRLREPGPKIIDLARGEAVEWLGYSVRLAQGTVTIRVAESAYARLELKLAQALNKDSPGPRAQDTVVGWLAQLGPCLQAEARDGIYARVRALAATYGFEELPPKEYLDTVCDKAEADWQAILAGRHVPAPQPWEPAEADDDLQPPF